MTEHDELRALEARDAIGRVIVLYGRLLDEHRWSEFGELFTTDATWRSAELVFESREAIVEGLRALQPPTPGAWKHLSFTPTIDFETTTSARVWTDFAFLVFAKERWSIATAGCCHDHFVVDGRRWRFASRHADLQGDPARALPAGWTPSPGS
jgi:hypothetical protein